MKPSNKLRAFLLGSTLLAAPSLHAQKIWIGTDNLWTNTNNWSPTGAPGAAADVTFDGTGANLATSLNSVARTINTLNFTSGQTAQVTITTTNTAALTIDNTPAITVAAGDHRFIGTNGGSGTNPDLIFTGTSPIAFAIAGGASFDINGKISGNKTYQKTGTGTLIISSTNGGGTSWAHGGFAVQEGILRMSANQAAGNSGNNFTVSSGAAIEVTGGVSQGFSTGLWTITGTGVGATGAIRSTSGNNTLGNLAGAGGIALGTGGASIGVNADTLTVNAIIKNGTGNALTKVGAGTLILANVNTYTGATSVDAGTLEIASGGSTHADSAVTVSNSGSALIVNGTINGALNANVSTTVSGSGTVVGAAIVSGNLNPGTSPGVLSFGNDLTMASSTLTSMEILGLNRATDYDGINVGGTLGYGGNMVINFGTTFGADATFDLFDLFTGTSGSFESVELTGSYTAPLVNNSGVWSAPTNAGNETWSFDQGTGVLTLTVIPEPSTALLGAIGLLALLRRRR